MGKNNKLIDSIKTIANKNRSKNIAQAMDKTVQYLYAALSLALHDEVGFDSDDISRILNRSQDIWVEFTGTGEDIVKRCEEETGICLIAGQKPEEEELDG